MYYHSVHGTVILPGTLFSVYMVVYISSVYCTWNYILTSFMELVFYSVHGTVFRCAKIVEIVFQIPRQQNMNIKNSLGYTHLYNPDKLCAVIVIK